MSVPSFSSSSSSAVADPQVLQSLAWLQVDPGGRVGSCSGRLCSLLGVPAPDLLGASFAQLFCAQELGGQLPQAHSILAANQSGFSASAHWRHASGNLLPVGLHYCRLLEAAAQAATQPFCVPLWVVVVPIDTPGQLQDSLMRLQLQLEDAHRLRELTLQTLERQLGERYRQIQHNLSHLSDTPSGIAAAHQLGEAFQDCQKLLQAARLGQLKLK